MYLSEIRYAQPNGTHDRLFLSEPELSEFNN
jgi:hypothetical protein